MGQWDMSDHILHVWGCWVDAASQLVVQLDDLLTVRPADGPTGPIASRVAAGAVVVCFLLVTAQQLPELLRVRQEEGTRVPDAQQQEGEGEDREPGHGSAGHSSTSAVWVWTVRAEETLGFVQTLLLRVPDTTCGEEMSNEFFPAVWVNKVEQITK